MSDYSEPGGDETLPLFAAVQTGLCRSDDPQTSAEGALHIAEKLSGKRAVFLHCLKQIGHASTASEVAAKSVELGLVECAESVRKRAGELVRYGLIERAGSRPCNTTGQRCTVYWFIESSVARKGAMCAS